MKSYKGRYKGGKLAPGSWIYILAETEKLAQIKVASIIGVTLNEVEVKKADL